MKLVIKETLHLHPPVSIIPRACREECEICGYRVPLNSNMIVNIWVIEEIRTTRRIQKVLNQRDFLGKSL